MSWHPPCNLPSPARGLPVGFGTFAFCSLCPYAARCPVPVASDDAELTPELFFHGMLMTDGCDGTRTRNHGHRQSAHPHQAPCCGPGPGVPFSLHAAAACGLQPTSVSALSSRARMSSGTDPGQGCRSPGRHCCAGFGWEMPSARPRAVRGVVPRLRCRVTQPPNQVLIPARPWKFQI